MSNSKNNIFENINFKAFSQDMTEVVKNAVEKYWEQDIQVNLYAVNDFRELRDEQLTKNTDFFSSQIKVDGHNPVIIRLSKSFIDEFLSVSLKRKGLNFELTFLTPLEIKILNNFCEFLYKKISTVLIPSKEVKLSEKSEKYINILFMLILKDGENTNLMLSVPYDRIRFSNIKKSISFKDEDFLNSKATVRIRAGSSKVTLDELKNLSKDDIVLLENSDSSKLTLISGELEKKFNVKVSQALILNIDDNSENQNQINNEVQMEKNLWDDIQIEINAEFEKVKMTIGELKQITQGQVVDLGSVFDNEISLFVEDKKVAKGELIIINDRYAVRLNEVLSSNPIQPEKATTQPKVQQQTPIKPQAQQPQRPSARPAPPRPNPQPKVQSQPKVADEEFDYSDFEN